MAKPTVHQIEMQLLAETPLGSDAEATPDQQFRIDQQTPRMAVKLRKIRPDAAQINEPINQPQQAILRNRALKRERIEQRSLASRRGTITANPPAREEN